MTMNPPIVGSLFPLRAAFVIATLGCLWSPGSVEANDLDACVEASEAAQALRDEGKYLLARKNLLLCARDVCPAAVRRDCLSELDRLDAATPSVVFSVSGVAPDRVPGVKISVQGHDETYGVTGRPVQVDPGPHSIRFGLDEDTVELSVVFKAGDANRPVEGAFAKPDQTRGAASSVTPSTDSPDDAGPNWLGYSLVGAGALALGGMTVLWVRGRGELEDLREGCGATQSCDEGDVDSARNTILLGDVIGGVGVLAIGVGVYALATGASTPKQDALRLDASMGARDAGISLSGVF